MNTPSLHSLVIILLQDTGNWEIDKIALLQWVSAGLLAAVISLIIWIFLDRDKELKKNTEQVTELISQHTALRNSLEEHIKQDSNAFEGIDKRFDKVDQTTRDQTQTILTGVQKLLGK